MTLRAYFAHAFLAAQEVPWLGLRVPVRKQGRLGVQLSVDMHAAVVVCAFKARRFRDMTSGHGSAVPSLKELLCVFVECL